MGYIQRMDQTVCVVLLWLLFATKKLVSRFMCAGKKNLIFILQGPAGVSFCCLSSLYTGINICEAFDN